MRASPLSFCTLADPLCAPGDSIRHRESGRVISPGRRLRQGKRPQAGKGFPSARLLFSSASHFVTNSVDGAEYESGRFTSEAQKCDRSNARFICARSCLWDFGLVDPFIRQGGDERLSRASSRDQGFRGPRQCVHRGFDSTSTLCASQVGRVPNGKGDGRRPPFGSFLGVAPFQFPFTDSEAILGAGIQTRARAELLSSLRGIGDHHRRRTDRNPCSPLQFVGPMVVRMNQMGEPCTGRPSLLFPAGGAPVAGCRRRLSVRAWGDDVSGLFFAGLFLSRPREPLPQRGALFPSRS
ncbi:hypothetical protein MRX96_041861 [Rhipicephalus microplus]